MQFNDLLIMWYCNYWAPVTVQALERKLQRDAIVPGTEAYPYPEDAYLALQLKEHGTDPIYINTLCFTSSSLSVYNGPRKRHYGVACSLICYTVECNWDATVSAPGTLRMIQRLVRKL